MATSRPAAPSADAPAGDAPPRARVQEIDFDPSVEAGALQAGRLDVGAIVTFTGCVRALDAVASGKKPVSALTLEHYPGMTERAIDGMIDEATERFAILDARVIHRVGRLEAGERIVWVGVAATHRRPAFDACEFLMDYLKTQAPFWKKEATAEGERWVEALVADDDALARWGISNSNAASLSSRGKR